jgi:uncharacterized OB-fold protein
MALVKCPECSSEVSDKAESCPKCGFPLAKEEATESQGGKIQTIELTSKKRKLRQVWCALVGVGSFAILIIGAFSANSATMVIGGTGIAFALVWAIATGIQIWWHHK